MKTRKVQGKGRQGKSPAVCSAGKVVASSPAAEERDASGRRKRLEVRAVEEAARRCAARNGQRVVGVVKTIQQVVAEDCERWHLTARGAAKASGLAHPTTSRLLKAEGKSYCHSLDRLIDRVGEDEVVLLKRVIRKIETERRRQG